MHVYMQTESCTYTYLFISHVFCSTLCREVFVSFRIDKEKKRKKKEHNAETEN